MDTQLTDAPAGMVRIYDSPLACGLRQMAFGGRPVNVSRYYFDAVLKASSSPSEVRPRIVIKREIKKRFRTRLRSRVARKTIGRLTSVLATEANTVDTAAIIGRICPCLDSVAAAAVELALLANRQSH